VIDLLKTNLDAVAFVWFCLLAVVFKAIAHWSPLQKRTITAAVQQQRTIWMRNMALRESRMLDGLLLSSLSQGNAFFASTSAIAIGGLATVLGSGERAQEIMQQIPYAAKSSPALWESKVVLLMVIFVYAFFKFAWAFRLSHYTAIMIGSTPDPKAAAGECELHAERTARLIGLAADHANSGLRSYYYAIAAIAWFVHPLLFMLATTWVLAILLRRELFSRSNRIIAGRWP